MQFLHQIRKKALRIFKYSLVYILIAFFIISIFGTIYYQLKIETPWQTSENIFWGIDTNIPETIRYFGISEIIIKDIFFIVWVGSFLSKFLSPLNPIFFSKYVVCQTDLTSQTSQMEFRYWIMYPAHKFLYNIHIRIFLSEGCLYNGGKNKLHTEWELDNPDIQDYAYARGVHYVIIKGDESLFSKIKQTNNELLTIMIHGNDQNGIIFRGQHSYRTKDFLKEGYGFVSIRQPECIALVKNAFGDLGYKNNDKLIRYENFDKIYKPLSVGCSAEQLNEKPDADRNNADVLTYKQIAEGTYGDGLRQKMLDMINNIISRYLNKNSENDFK